MAGRQHHGPRTVLLLLLSSAAWQGCQIGPGLVVNLSSIPTGSANLQVLASLNGNAANESPIVELANAAGNSPFSFALRFPVGASGTVKVGVAAVNQTGCLLAVGEGQTVVSEADAGIGAKIDVPLVLRKPPECSYRPPLVWDVQPAQASTAGGDTLTIRGWGFHPQAKVRIAGQEARVTSVSPGTITAVVPSRLGMAGKADVVVANPNGSQYAREDLFSYFYGSFGFAGTVYPVGSSADTALAVADLDGDGLLDIALGIDDQTVGVLLNQGQGKFPSVPRSQSVCMLPIENERLAVADLNQDGRPDLVVICMFGGIGILFNQGGGTFGDMQFYDAGVPASLAVGDLNGDGLPDIVVADNQQASAVLVLINVEKGTSFHQVSYGAGTTFTDLAIVDLNGDGRPDVVGVYQYYSDTVLTGGVEVLINQGGGVLSPPTNYFTGQQPISVATGDLDGDGRPDLALVNPKDSVSVLLNQGTGRLSAQPANYGVRSPQSLAAVDLGGNGRLDLAIGADLNGFQVLLNQGQGAFRPVAVNTTGPGYHSYSIVAGDLDRDGKQDLVVGTSGGPVVFLNRSQ